MSELRPCPFCGGKAKLYNTGFEKTTDYEDGDFYTRWYVKCTGCGVRRGNYSSAYIFDSKEEALRVGNRLGGIVLDGRAEAINAWNKRASNETGRDNVAYDG